jgi:hypothetical protein
MSQIIIAMSMRRDVSAPAMSDPTLNGIDA